MGEIIINGAAFVFLWWLPGTASILFAHRLTFPPGPLRRGDLALCMIFGLFGWFSVASAIAMIGMNALMNWDTPVFRKRR